MFIWSPSVEARIIWDLRFHFNACVADGFQCCVCIEHRSYATEQQPSCELVFCHWWRVMDLASWFKVFRWLAHSDVCLRVKAKGWPNINFCRHLDCNCRHCGSHDRPASLPIDVVWDVYTPNGGCTGWPFLLHALLTKQWSAWLQGRQCGSVGP